LKLALSNGNFPEEIFQWTLWQASIQVTLDKDEASNGSWIHFQLDTLLWGVSDG
jgi:hypothetical protein